MIDKNDIYVAQGYGQRLGFGRFPALLIIDLTNAFADPALFGGGNIDEAIAHTVPLLAAARLSGVPIMFSTHAYAADGIDHGLMVQKNHNLKRLVAGTDATAIVADLAPRDGELVLSKRHPSAFFGTDLLGWLSARNVDTVLICGCTTSGCIRATAVDALGYGLRPIVIRDCVGDRALQPHLANLFDLEQKYADVVPLRAALDHLAARSK